MTKEHNLMINEASRALRQLIAGKSHPPPCLCPACLYAEFQKRKKRPGQPRGKFIFFLDWLVWRIKTDALVEKRGNFAARTITNFRKRYKKTPYLRRIREIFDSLSKRGFEEDWLLDYNIVCVYKSRFESDGFVKLIESLQRKRYLDYYQTEPIKSKVKNNWASLRLAQRVGRFIHAQPKKQITQHALLRHFSNERKSDFTDILGTLEGNFRIRTERRGKSIIYRVT